MKDKGTIPGSKGNKVAKITTEVSHIDFAKHPRGCTTRHKWVNPRAVENKVSVIEEWGRYQIKYVRG